MKRTGLRAAALICGVALLVPTAGYSDALAIDFESYALGAVHGQDGWSSSGSVGSGCALYDVEVDEAATYGHSALGQALRISNARTSGCFGDQTFSKSLLDEAGEADADAGGFSGGTRLPVFTAEWTFASADPSAEQVGLQVVASPDRGDGARMSWIQMADMPDGLAVNFYGYDTTLGGTCSNLTNFVYATVASGLDRAVPHTIKIEMLLLDGGNNDIITVSVDGGAPYVGSTWEDYFRNCQPVAGDPVSRTVDSMLFRVAGGSAPDTLGGGFLIDDVAMTSELIPTTASGEPVVPLSDPARLELVGHLTSSLGPVVGRTLTFKTASGDLCTATTDATGTARCDALPALAAVVQAQGYRVDFAGDALYAASQGIAGFIGS